MHDTDTAPPLGCFLRINGDLARDMFEGHPPQPGEVVEVICSGVRTRAGDEEWEFKLRVKKQEA